ncbi:MAG: tRNA 2-thiocytidine biosynthesis protein TtcA [Eubacterium sp.]|nr:tRNA 2-thiocytidine biosynthesis protein TtcA [Eubacterium sp.]
MSTTSADIERSIQKTYHKKLWTPFIQAVKSYHLIEENDRIAVCISGGKDSWLMAKLMEMLHRITEIPFELKFIVMDPGYAPANRCKIEENAKKFDLDIDIFESDIFEVANSTDKSPCYLCARMRRGALYAKARDIGCNKIALGHHFNDVIETTVMAMFYGAQLQAMIPKLHSTNFPGMELIRPLYCVHEDDIIAWRDFNRLDFLQCACRLTEGIANSTDGIGDSKRQEIKKLLKDLKKDNPGIEMSIFHSLHAVHIDTFPGYKEDGVKKSFLERYDQRVVE